MIPRALPRLITDALTNTASGYDVDIEWHGEGPVKIHEED